MLDPCLRDLSIDFKLDKLLFGAIKLTKTIAFDLR